MNILDYIKGKRKGQAANRLEREAMQDPFLHDALEGFDQIEGDHAADIEMLRKKLATKQNRERPPVLRFFKKRWTVAASYAILLIGIGFLIALLYNNFPQEKNLAMRDAISEESSAPVPDSEKDAPLSEEHHKIEEVELLKDDLHSKDVKGQTVDFIDVIAEESLLEDFDIVEVEMATTDLPVNYSADLSKIDSYVPDTFVSAQKISKPIEIEKAEFINRETAVVRGNRSDDQEIIIDGVRVKEQKRKGRKQHPDDLSFSQDIIQNFDRSVCPDMNGTIIVEFYIDGKGNALNIEFTGQPCEEFRQEITRQLNLKKDWNEKGRFARLQFHF